MKLKVASTLVASLVAGLAMSSVANANDYEGAFIGGGLGWSRYQNLTDLSTDQSGIERDAVSSRLMAGYTFNQFVGLEAGYNWLGHANVDSQTWRTDGWNVSVLPRYPLTKDISLLGELGVMRWYGTNDSKAVTDNGYAPVYGVGAAYRLSDALDLQARYRYVDEIGSIETGRSDVHNFGLEIAYYPTRSSTPAPVAKPAPAPVVEPAPAPQEVVETKRFTLTSDVLFDFGKATLKPEGQAALTKLYNQINSLEMKDHQTVVYGYTDRIGSDAANQALSQKRAQSVAAYLTSKGIPANNISAVGRGESSPVTGTSCNSVKNRKALIVCLAPDRRVEIEVKGVKEVVVKK
ncbi:MAG: porin OmpA [Aeromonadaceae bacterium]|nr:porin OmpA [Aeromonadaceae bacterium]